MIPLQMYIALTDGQGIDIKSNKPILIEAKGAINLQSGDAIKGAGSGSVEILQGQTQTKLSGDNYSYSG